jgi:hypothetical protein
MPADLRRPLALGLALRTAIRNCVRLTATSEGVRVYGPLAFPASTGLKVHMNPCSSALDRLYRRARRIGDLRGKRDITFSSRDLAVALGLAEALRGRLLHFAIQPVDQANVERLLGISRVECNRWTKDQRLRTSGFLTMSHTLGSQIRRPTYAPSTIDQLLVHPETIEQWRREDRTRSNFDRIARST